MVEYLEDRSFKRLAEKFPIPLLKYLRIKHEMANPYPNKIELYNDERQLLDYVIKIYENKLLNIEFHSSILTIKHLGKYGTYKINLRIYSGKYVYQAILCTADPESSKKQLCINDEEELKMNIIFTLEDDADEKIKILEEIIYNNKKLTNTDIEIIYLTVALYMKSNLSKSELLLKIAELTNEVQGLSKEELYEIKIFQTAFMKKFISDDDKLKGEIEKMISINSLEAMREIFPEESKQEREEAMQIGQENGIQIGEQRGEKRGEKRGINLRNIEIVQNMKEQKYNLKEISNITGLTISEIKQI